MKQPSPSRSETITLRLTLPNDLSIDRTVPWWDRKRELRRLNRALEAVNEHVQFTAARAELVEG